MSPASIRLPAARARQPRRTAEASAILTIDLGAIRANYRLLRDRLGDAACAGVVKADAYGLGAAEVARALLREGCRTFFVAQLEEGIALRDTVGATPDIYVLNGIFPGSAAACVDAALMPVLNSAGQARDWARAAHGLGRKLPAALQVDSGMARLGMPPAEFVQIIDDATCRDHIDFRLVMSHLACADEPDHPANRKQLAEFGRLRDLLPAVPASLANSSGIFLGGAYHYDLARPGAALYGINPTPGQPNPMRPVARLDARVIQTRDVQSGDGIGYAHIAVADRAMRLATIALGYADGWHRNAVATAFHAGVRLPFVGRVSMDSIILDISALRPGTPGEGELVEIIGEAQTVDDVAALAGTIGDEILTSLGSRFQRIYLDGDPE